MWYAKNKKTGKVYGPFADAYKQALEQAAETRKRFIWTKQEAEPALPKPENVKAAKTEKAISTSGGGE